eukprot:scaffold20913_cov104-Skeletonema_marinoi.AAC.2
MEQRRRSSANDAGKRFVRIWYLYTYSPYFLKRSLLEEECDSKNGRKPRITSEKRAHFILLCFLLSRFIGTASNIHGQDGCASPPVRVRENTRSAVPDDGSTRDAISHASHQVFKSS